MCDVFGVPSPPSLLKTAAKSPPLNPLDGFSF